MQKSLFIMNSKYSMEIISNKMMQFLFEIILLGFLFFL